MGVIIEGNWQGVVRIKWSAEVENEALVTHMGSELISPLSNYMTLSKLLNLSKPQFPYLGNGTITVPTL